MAEFKFLKNPTTGKVVISAPRRAKRMDVSKKAEPVCPFCIGRESEEEELYRVRKFEIQNPKSETNTNDKNTKRFENSDFENLNIVSNFDIRASNLDKNTDWLVRVILNKFPFTPHHEIVVLSPDHHKGFDELPFSHIELILKTYRERYNANSQYGQPYIFHNGGLGSGESIPHPHTQLVVLPEDILLEIPSLDMEIYKNIAAINSKSEVRNSKQYQNSNSKNLKRFGFSNLKNLNLFRISDFDIRISLLGQKSLSNSNNVGDNPDFLETESFLIFCPKSSGWPDEVWVAPKREGQFFGSIVDEEITDLAFVISRLIQIFDFRHGHEFPFNFYIYPGKHWYFRLIPRVKVLGGFELGTGVMVNTQDPFETLAFIKEHFWKPDVEKIRTEHRADYVRGV